MAGAVKKAGAALGAALGGASAGVTLQAVGPALLQAVAGLLLAVPVGPALLQAAAAALLLAVADLGHASSSKKSVPIIKLSSAIYVADRLLKQLAKYSIYL